MYRLRIVRNLRTLAFLLVFAAFLAALSALWWVNHIGLPDSWRAEVEQEVEKQFGKQGVYVKIGGLRYLPLRGLSVEKVRFFADPAHQHELSRLESALLDFDKAKLARGEVHVSRIELKNANLFLPIEPDNPASDTINITSANGIILMPGNRCVEIREATGTVANIQVAVEARLIGQRPSDEPASRKDFSEDFSDRRKLLAGIVAKINQWKFDPKSPPRLRIFLERDLNQSSSLSARISLSAPELSKNQHALRNISASAEMSGDLFTVTSLSANDSRGQLSGKIDYDLSERSGRFDLKSSLDLPPLLKSWFGVKLPKDIAVSGSQNLETEGEFSIDKQNIPQLRMTGAASFRNLTLREISFASLQTSFAWKDRELFLKDLQLSRADGKAQGKVLVQWPFVRLALTSDFPMHLYKPLFIGKPLEIVIDSFSAKKNSAFWIQLEGGFDATNPESWAYTGSGTIENMAYKGVPANLAKCRFSLNHNELEFSDGSVNFDYKKYPLREAFNGPASATGAFDRISYNANTKLVSIDNIGGPIWISPLVRFFAPKIADSLEVYRFHTPPSLHGSGNIDVTPQGRTNLTVTFKTSDAADYKFLGENLTLLQPKGKVLVTGKQVSVNKLKFNTLEGPVACEFDYLIEPKKLSGEVQWTRLSAPALCSTYKLDLKSGGELTGRINFSIIDSKITTMAGEGLFAIGKTELFSVPIFGPLSPLVSGILGNKRVGFERAKSAFCNFRIKEGILSTRDFQTSTRSLTFTGDGSINLADRTLDFTMRMNARGLLGLITLPLRPFYGMFQFRGTGPLKKPVWENVMFTSPPADQNEILTPPPKAISVEENAPPRARIIKLPTSSPPRRSIIPRR